MSDYTRYTVMVIDDEITHGGSGPRMLYYNNFLTNEWMTTDLYKNKMPEASRRRDICGPDFTYVYANSWDEFNAKLKHEKPDAFFIDVILQSGKFRNTEEKSSLKDVLQKIVNTYTDSAGYPPIFLVSGDWKESTINMSNQVFTELSNLKSALLPSYRYTLNDLKECINGVINENVALLDPLKEERERVYRLILSSKQYTTKKTFSPDGDVVILHISDLQYGDPKTSEKTSTIFNNIAAKISELKDAGEMHGVDLLVISGDLAMHGKRSEYALGKEIKKTLCELLWPDEKNGEYRERILLVPGNHDFDLNYCLINYLNVENMDKSRKLDFSKAAIALAAVTDESTPVNEYGHYGFTAFKEWASELTGSDILYKSKSLNYVNNRFRPWGLRFLCLNTVSGITAFETNHIGCDQESIRELSTPEQLKNNGLLTIAISHHSPLLLSKIPATAKANLEECFAGLRNNLKCLLFLGGHQHKRHSGRRSTSNKEPYLAFESASLRVIPKNNTEARVRGFSLLTLKKGSPVSAEDAAKPDYTGGFDSVIERCFYFDESDGAVLQKQTGDADVTLYRMGADRFKSDSHGVMAEFYLTPRGEGLSEREIFYRLLAEAEKSKCRHRKVAAAIALDGEILVMKANLPREGRPDCGETGCLRDELTIPSGEQPQTCRCVHAEAAVLNELKQKLSKNPEKIKECILYCLLSPCADCADKIAEMGIAEICFLEDYPCTQYVDKLRAAGIPSRKYEYDEGVGE